MWDAITFRLMIVGEAANHLSEEVRARAEVDWRGVVGLRNVIAHEYFDLRRESFVKTVEADILALRDAVVKLLTELDG